MQYILTKEEMDQLKTTDSRYTDFMRIMYNISIEYDVKKRLELYDRLFSDFAYADQDGDYAPIINAWNARHKGEV